VDAKTTEQLHSQAQALDARPVGEAARLMVEAQVAAASVVSSALQTISEASEAMAQTIRNGGALHYAAAGSSGLMAAADALELGGTFSIPSHQVCIHMAGGLPSGSEMPGDVEDDIGSLQAAFPVEMSADTVIAVAASGSTPYTLHAAKLGRERGATVIAIANNRDSPLLALAGFPILLETPPEVLSGSTRLGAGTSQKIALNTLSTLMGLRLGHIHDGMMVNVKADNAKLRGRAQSIVTQIAGVAPADAQHALDNMDGDVKAAILHAKGATAAHASALLSESDGHLRPALARLET